MSGPAKALERCPFCGSADIDPEGVAFIPKRHHGMVKTWDYAKPDQIEHRPACTNCGASTDGDWNARPANLYQPDFTIPVASIPDGWTVQALVHRYWAHNMVTDQVWVAEMFHLKTKDGRIVTGTGATPLAATNSAIAMIAAQA
jgi:hypothetical protein